MVLFLVASLALAGESTPVSGASGSPPAPPPAAEPPPAAAPAPVPPPASAPPSAPSAPAFDVYVVHPSDPVGVSLGAAPASPAAPAPIDVTVVRPGQPAPIDVTVVKPGEPAPIDVTVVKPAAPAPFDVTVVKPGAPTGAVTVVAPEPGGTGTASYGAPLGGNITPPPPPPGTPPPPPPPADAPPGYVSPIAAAVPVEAVPPVAPVVVPAGPPPGVGLRLTKADAFRVKDADGNRYTTLQFARMVGDDATLKRLARREDNTKIAGTAVAIAGAGLLVASIVVVTSQVGMPVEMDYAVDPTVYPTEEQYVVATEFAQGQYDKAVGSWQSQRLGTTLFLAGSGGLLLASAPFIGRDMERRYDRPDLVYKRDEAQRLVDKYNLDHPRPGAPAPEGAPSASASGAAAPEAAPAPPPPPAEEEPPEPDEPPVPAAAPRDPNAPLDLDDDAPPHLRAHLLIGVGMLGVTGSF